MSTATLAAVLRATGRDGSLPPAGSLAIEELSLDAPRDGEVEVAPATACICHSDLSVMTGVRPRPTPIVLGHEASGIVTAVGPGVSRYRPGDHVLMSYVPSCGHCRQCRRGRPALCEPGNRANREGALLTGRRPFHDDDGAAVNQHLGLSAFAQATVVCEESLVQLPVDLPLDVAALFGCAVTTGVGAVVNTARVSAGSTVAVFGLGGVGLSVVLGAILVGAAQIVGVDVAANKLSRARELGANPALLGGSDTVECIRDLTGGGVDHAFDTTGSPAALKQAYASTCSGGVTTVVGLAHPSAEISLSLVELVGTERSLRGCYMGSAVPARDVPWMIDAHRAGRLPVERLIGERFILEELSAGMERLHAGVIGRQLVEIGSAA
ncbi:MAG: zinc-binding dehydrogenase [Solirubrobacteraceae bacterium]